MAISEGDATNSVMLDEERREASHQGGKASIDDDVNAHVKRELARVEPRESAELADDSGQVRGSNAETRS
jgi:hypothetical protein